MYIIWNKFDLFYLQEDTEEKANIQFNMFVKIVAYSTRLFSH